jgi:glycerone phosphate O-acyltransferase/fatty acyl-CoA reductase
MSVQWFSETLHEERVIPHFESCSLDTIKNSLTKFKQMKVIKMSGRGKNCDVSILYNMKQLIELRDNMNRFLKTPVTKAAL